VANKFIIDEMDLTDPDYFMASANVKEVGKRTRLWSEEDQARGYFSFKKVYSPNAGPLDHANTNDRRTWQLFNRVAPSLKLPTESKDPYPFSVKAEHKISLDEVMSFNRDTFEGSPFDLNVGPAAGPWGNPNRYDGNGEPYTQGILHCHITCPHMIMC
jgi:dipeptidase